MIRSSRPTRGSLISRAALSAALALGVATGGMILATPAMAAKEKKQEGPKIEFSPDFAKAAAELDKTIAEASKNSAVAAATAKLKAAQTPEAKAAAGAEVDAALGGAKAKLPAVTAAATTPGDKLKAGELARNVGVLTDDLALNHQGLTMMIDSGVVAPEQLGQLQFLAGVTAYQKRDYAGAVKYLKPAMDSGFKDPQGLLPTVLADAYKKTNNSGAALGLAQQELQAAKASGAKPSETAIRTALQAAYDAKQSASAFDLAAQLVQNYPAPSSWNAAITVVRAMSPLQTQDNLDLMRLMARTGAMDDRTDYVEYIQNADPRRLPGETLKVIDAGLSSGKITASDSFVAEAKQIATGRLNADKASLPGLERDARAGSASEATVSGAADAFLSYGQPAKAEEFYKIALSKPGSDKNRVMTRLGIAQIDQGKAAEAQQSFSQVQGARAPIAKLWSAYAASKGGGAAPAAQ